MSGLRKVFASAELEIRLLVYSPANALVTLLLFPVMYSIIYLIVLDFLNREDLGTMGMIGPALMGVWATSVGITGSIIDDERWNGSLEVLAVLPGGSFSLFLLGRTLASSALSLIAFVSTFVVAHFGFSVSFSFQEPLGIAAALILTVLSATGVGMIVGALLVLSRSAIQFQTTLTFPFYLLGGIAFPVSELPHFVQPLSYLISLSWISEILRDLFEGKPTQGLAWFVLSLLVIVYLGIGLYLIGALTRRAQTTGNMGYA